MGPGLLCGLASCAGFLLVAPAQAQDAPAGLKLIRAQSVKPANVVAPRTSNFRNNVATILAQSPTGARRAWSDIDRDRLKTNFRLPATQKPNDRRAGPVPSGAQALALRATLPTATPVGYSAVPASENFASALKVSRDAGQRQSVSFGVDSGISSGPSDDDDPSPARKAAQHMSDAGTCAGLMPAFACYADSGYSGNDSVVALAFAYNF